MDNNRIPMSRNTVYIPFLSIVLSFCLVTACKKLVEVDPPIQEIVGSEIFRTNETAASVLTGIYQDMSTNGIFAGYSSISLYTGLTGDELVPITPPSDLLNILYRNALTNNGDLLFWNNLYGYIFRVNSATEGISSSSGITSDVKKQLLGETAFLRAFMYFYLVNFYGDVPLVINTDVKANSIAQRTDRNRIFEQIIEDLNFAKNNLSQEYFNASISGVVETRVRPNKAAAIALLARVYLYTRQWQLAEVAATEIITNSQVYSLESLERVFKNDSKEAIWQLQPVDYSYNTLDATIFVLKALPEGPNSIRPVFLNKLLVSSFEKNDGRKSIWIDSVNSSGTTYYYANKYKVYLPDQPVTEYLTVLRLAEQYLIRAEARARMGNLIGVNSASSDINIIRSRAGLPKILSSSLDEIIEAILRERKAEFFTEFGHRWLDLKRTGEVDVVMNYVAPLKGGTWQSFKSLFPIPVYDIQVNPNLRGHQNPGYPEL